MLVTQEVPNYADAKPQSADVADTEEMLALGWVAQWQQDGAGQQFHRFSRSGNKLMVEHNEGTWWWVVAYADPDLLESLPEWVPVREDD